MYKKRQYPIAVDMTNQELTLAIMGLQEIVAALSIRMEAMHTEMNALRKHRCSDPDPRLWSDK